VKTAKGQEGGAAEEGGGQERERRRRTMADRDVVAESFELTERMAAVRLAANFGDFV